MRLQPAVRTFLAGLAAHAALVSPLAAGPGEPSEGTSSLAVLKLPLGSRASALAGAYTSIAEGSEGAFFNPAGLSQLPAPEVHFTHHSLYEGLSVELLSAAYPFADRQALGAHLILFGTGDIPLAREDAAGVYDAASSLGTYSNSNLVAAVSYSAAPTGRLALGLSLKHFRDSVGGPEGGAESGQAADLGMLFRLGPARLGASALNLGGKLGGSSLASSLRLAAGLEAKPLGVPALLAAELVHPLDGSSLRRLFGLEIRPLEHINLGAGYRMGANREKTQSGLTVGLGLAWRNFQLQFSFLPYGELGSIGTFSVTYRFVPAPAEPQ